MDRHSSEYKYGFEFGQMARGFVTMVLHFLSIAALIKYLFSE
jgi:hypothetical protein